jgi:hypothetical protein
MQHGITVKEKIEEFFHELKRKALGETCNNTIYTIFTLNKHIAYRSYIIIESYRFATETLSF